MYAKVKLPDEFVKGDCEHCPFCIDHYPILETYDTEEEWHECIFKHCITNSIVYSDVSGTADSPQKDCKLKIVK